jgi:hypothetical protein
MNLFRFKILLILIVVLTSVAFGQETKKPQFGFLFQPSVSTKSFIGNAKYHDFYSSDDVKETIKPSAGYDFGFVLLFYLGKKSFIESGFRYKIKGFVSYLDKSYFSNNEGVTTDHFLSFPLLFGYEIANSNNNRFSIKIGTSVDIWSKHKKDFFSKVEDIEIDILNTRSPHISYPLILGLSYHYYYFDKFDLFIEPQFNYELLKNSEAQKIKSRYITLGLSFGVLFDV